MTATPRTKTRSFAMGTCLMAAFAVLIHLHPAAGQILQLDRAAVGAGEIWRIFTGHFTHFGWNHLAWDLAMFIVLGAVCERIDRRGFITTVAGAVVVISAAVLWHLPGIRVYRGLSGVDSALFGFLAATIFAQCYRHGPLKRAMPTAILVGGLLLAFCLKIGVELVQGVAVFADSVAEGFVPVPLAHAVGLCVGVVVAASRMQPHDNRSDTQRWDNTGGRRSVA